MGTPAAVTEVQPAPRETDPAPAETAQVDVPEAAEVGEDAPAIEPAGVEPQAEIDAGAIRVSVAFSGDCWTEITDANGRRLFFDLGRDGRTIDISGEAPLSVLFGNADNVSMRVNGLDYAIRDTDRRGQTARLTLHSQ